MPVDSIHLKHPTFLKVLQILLPHPRADKPGIGEIPMNRGCDSVEMTTLQGEQYDRPMMCNVIQVTVPVLELRPYFVREKYLVEDRTD